MTERKTIKTEYSKLNECLEKLNIEENIRYGEHLPTEWHEIKVAEDNDGVTMIRPIEVKDLVALFELISSQPKENEKMTEELKRSGYQPSKTNIKNPIPPSTGSNVKAKKNGYTWEDVDKAWWEGFDYCKEKLEKQILVWHDLRKDSNDLPERMGLGSKEVYVSYEGDVTDFACYRFDKEIWERSEDDEEAVGVIAWCEIPIFKE